VPEKNPDNFDWIRVSLPYAWVLLLSIFGGIVNFMQKVRSGEISRFSITELFGEMVTSAFAGVITFLLCKAADINELITAALVGVAGHMGSRLIFKLEKYLMKRYGP